MVEAIKAKGVSDDVAERFKTSYGVWLVLIKYLEQLEAH